MLALFDLTFPNFFSVCDKIYLFVIFADFSACLALFQA